jgi:superfamily II DNA or RNA helicase/HKD family nuclease
MPSVLNLPNERRMVEVVREGLSWADQACFAVSFTRCSGLGLLIDPLKELIDRQGRVQLLTSTYQSVTQPEALESLLRLKGLECYLQDGPTGFHSKFWLFGHQQRGECWAGSSNLSKGGLADNIEWNLRSIDGPVVEQTRRQFQSLLQRADVKPLSRELIDRYALRYAERADQPPLPMVAEGAAVPSLQPNEAQREALQRLANMREAGLKRAAIIAATGIGKTYLAAFDCQQMKAKSVLFVSHRLEHLTQAQRSFGRVLRDCDCRFETVQGLRTKPALLKRRWDYLVIDEFHHVEADGYRVLRPLRDNGHTFLLGLTATPERQDGRDILEWCDWNIAYEVRLPEAIERKWLLPFHYFAVADETIDFAQINWRRGMTPELEALLSVQERVDLILEQALLYGFDGPRRATVGFCAGIEHAKYMANAFNKRDQVALAVWGQHGIAEREAIYERLADPSDPLEWLFVADVLNEGVDIPAINSLMFLRPTESSSIFLQQLGRGLRLTPGCEMLTVLDFVGHHQRAWLALQSINDFTNTGAPVEIGDYVVKPPRSCEVVLQRKTLEMLEKIRRHTSKRDLCSETYETIKYELKDRAPLPIDLWQREGAPPLSDFRTAYGDWLGCQAAHGDLPKWATGLDDDHLARRFLRSLEADWQAQRVHAYATVWGLANGAADLARAYESFFEHFPQWRPEHAPFPEDSVARTFEKKLAKGSIGPHGLAKRITERIPQEQLRVEVEGRLLGTLNRAFEERHGGVLRTPADLRLHRFYRRPEIIRHFGVQYDPARHNVGMLRFPTDVVLITKLDTSDALERHQYENRFVDARRFEWTSQNRMRRDNEAGRTIVEHQRHALRIHLFVQASSHAEACYVGAVSFRSAKGDAPMRVQFDLEHALPEEVRRIIGG